MEGLGLATREVYLRRMEFEHTTKVRMEESNARKRFASNLVCKYISVSLSIYLSGASIVINNDLIMFFRFLLEIS